MELPSLQIRSVRARAVNAPIITPLITSRGSVDVAPLLLVDVETEEGVTGHGYAFCYMDLAAPFLVSVIERIDEMVRGEAADPRFLYKSLRGRFTLVGTEGSLGMALSAFDIACWDACAKAAGLPLYKLLGSNRNTIPAYNSKGLSLKEPAELADEALALLGEGFKAVKLRLGRRDVMADREAAKVVREAVPAGTVVMVDYNQALTPEDMIGRLALLEKFDPPGSKSRCAMTISLVVHASKRPRGSRSNSVKTSTALPSWPQRSISRRAIMRCLISGVSAASPAGSRRRALPMPQTWRCRLIYTRR